MNENFNWEIFLQNIYRKGLNNLKNAFLLYKIFASFGIINLNFDAFQLKSELTLYLYIIFCLSGC